MRGSFSIKTFSFMKVAEYILSCIRCIGISLEFFPKTIYSAFSLSSVLPVLPCGLIYRHILESLRDELYISPV